MTVERKNNDATLSRRAFLKKFGLGGIVITSLPFLLSGCEHAHSPDALQDNLNMIVRHLTAQPPQENDIQTDVGIVLHIKTYSDTFHFEKRRIIDITYSIPPPSTPTANTAPTLTIVDQHPTEEKNTISMTTIIDVNANGFNASELDLLVLKTYRHYGIVNAETFKSTTRSDEAIRQLNGLYARLTQAIVEKLPLRNSL